MDFYSYKVFQILKAQNDLLLEAFNILLHARQIQLKFNDILERANFDQKAAIFWTVGKVGA